MQLGIWHNGPRRTTSGRAIGLWDDDWPNHRRRR
jgi:hypothetical protein